MAIVHRLTRGRDTRLVYNPQTRKVPHIDPVLQPVDSKKQLMRAVVISEAGFPWKIFWWMEFIFQGIEELNALGPPSQLMSGYPRDLFGSSTCS